MEKFNESKAERQIIRIMEFYNNENLRLMSKEQIIDKLNDDMDVKYKNSIIKKVIENLINKKEIKKISLPSGGFYGHNESYYQLILKH